MECVLKVKHLFHLFFIRSFLRLVANKVSFRIVKAFTYLVHDFKVVSFFRYLNTLRDLILIPFAGLFFRDTTDTHVKERLQHRLISFNFIEILKCCQYLWREHRLDLRRSLRIFFSRVKGFRLNYGKSELQLW